MPRLVATASRSAWRTSGGIARSVAAANRAWGESGGSIRWTSAVGAVADVIIGGLYLPPWAVIYSPRVPQTPRVLQWSEAGVLPPQRPRRLRPWPTPPPPGT